MPQAKVLKAGDPCPTCGGEMKPVPVPSDEDYRRAFDRENPIALKPGHDTASPEQRQELGALHQCQNCGYRARFKDEGGDEARQEGDNGKAASRRR